MTGTGKEPVRVVLIDDHALVRNSFRSDFCKKNGFQTVGEGASASEVDNICRALRPELLIMDVCTEGNASGLDALERIRADYPEMKIIIMSGFDELSYAPRAKELGADAFVFKSQNSGFFLETARKVMAGGTSFPEPMSIPLPKGEAPFTEREMEILRLLCKRKNRTEIAGILSISKNTVSRHIEKMLEKSDFTSTFDMVVDIVSKGWINPNY